MLTADVRTTGGVLILGISLAGAGCAPKPEGIWIARGGAGEIMAMQVVQGQGRVNAYGELITHPDATLEGRFDADSLSGLFMEYEPSLNGDVQFTGIRYGTKMDGAVKRLVYIFLIKGKAKPVDAKTVRTTYEVEVYRADQDADGDGLVEPGEEPAFKFGPFEATSKRFP